MKGILIQVTAVVILSILHFAAAYSVTWISYTASSLESENSPIGVIATKAQINILASILVLGGIAGSLLTGQLPELVGRKKTELISGLFCTLAWALIVTANSISQLIAGRFFMGFGVGIHLMVVMMFINEISQAFIRGTMASLPLLIFSIGCLVSYVSGWVCSYNVINYLNLTACVLFVVLINFLKESPVFLINRKQDKEALKSLKFYRGTSKTTVAIMEEFEYLKKQQDNSINTYTEISKDEMTEKMDYFKEKEDGKSSEELTPWKTLVTSKSTQRAIVTLTIHVLITPLMGFMAVQMYAGHFFMAAAPDLSPHLCSVILAVAIVVGNVIAILGTDLVGRRVLLVSSCAICTVSLGVLVSLLRWSWAPGWAVPMVMLTYSCAFQAGVNNVPMVQLSESFMPKVKGIAASIIITSLSLSNFLLLSVFNSLVDHLGLDGTFLTFCIISAATTVVTFLTVKETKGVPLEAILGMYERGYFYWQ